MIYRKGTVQRIVHGQQQAFIGDQLVVGLPHLELVLRQLDAWGASPRAVDEDERLGLALVCLDPSTAVPRLRRQYLSWVNDTVAQAEEAGHEAPGLDVILTCLRRVLAGRYAGWVPELGKNRVLERVTGSYLAPGPSAGAPRPAGAVGNATSGRAGGGTTGEAAGDVGGGAGASPAPVLPRGRFPGNGAHVGIVDTRLRPHPWLAGGVVAGARDLQGVDEASRRDDSAHATFVAGLVLRQAPGAVIDLRAGLDDDGSTDSWSLAKDLVDLATRGAHVICLSVGCRTDDGRPPLLMEAALSAISPATMVVAAAGNHGRRGSDAPVPEPLWPAAMSRVLAVGALERGAPADFSPDAPWLDALAPGVDVVSTCTAPEECGAMAGPGGPAAVAGSPGFGRWSGTSLAAAAVSGAIAARVSDGVDAPSAWRELTETSKQDEAGRPLIGLRTPPTWPRDGDPEGPHRVR